MDDKIGKMGGGNPALQQVQKDWKVLDGDDFVIPPSVRIVTNIPDLAVDEIQAERVQPNRFVRLFRKISVLYQFLYAMQLIYTADRNSVAVIDGGGGSHWIFAGYINRFLVRFRRVTILSDCFLEYNLGKERRFWFFPFVKFKEMGRKGREHCEKHFTHEHYIRRNLRLALVVFEEYGKRNNPQGNF